jgi:hypothetical protein
VRGFGVVCGGMGFCVGIGVGVRVCGCLRVCGVWGVWVDGCS